MKTFVPHDNKNELPLPQIRRALDFDEGDYSSVVFPFCGCCRNALNMVSEGRRVVLADLDANLIHLIDTVLKYPRQLVSALEEWPADFVRLGLEERLNGKRHPVTARDFVVERGYEKLLHLTMQYPDFYQGWGNDKMLKDIRLFERRLQNARAIHCDYSKVLSGRKIHDFVFMWPPEGLDFDALASLACVLPCDWVVIGKPGLIEGAFSWAKMTKVKGHLVFAKKEVKNV
jgi:site-specific DNA-adenine methylase